MKEIKNDSSPNSITVLGSGTSTGIPIIGCSCKVCKSNKKENKRLRTSLFIETSESKHILVETSPDLRYQLINNNISDVDCAIISHDHADHLHGIDDLRPLCFGPPTKRIPVYCEKKSSKTIKKRFPYIFDKKPLIGGGIPLLDLRPVTVGKNKLQTVDICGESFQFFLLPHGRCQSLGFIHNSFIYMPDCSHVPPSLLKLLHAINPTLLVITCLQDSPHETHLNIDKSFQYIDKIAPKRAVLIHMNHNLDHDKLALKAAEKFNLPVEPAYDGAKYHY